MKMMKRAAPVTPPEAINPYTLHLDAVMPNLRAGNKKQVLQDLARKAAEITGASQDEISTRWSSASAWAAPASAAASPSRTASCRACRVVFTIMARFGKAGEFEAIDEQPVDLMVLLLAPAEAGARSPESACPRFAPAAQRRYLRKAARLHQRGRDLWRCCNPPPAKRAPPEKGDDAHRPPACRKSQNARPAQQFVGAVAGAAAERSLRGRG